MNTAGKITLFLLGAAAVGGIAYAVTRDEKSADGPLLGTAAPATPPTVRSPSGDPAGYNTQLWKSAEVVQYALGSAAADSASEMTAVFGDLLKTSLGYGRVTVNVAGTDPKIQEFQADWNAVADAATLGKIVPTGQAVPGQIGVSPSVKPELFVGRLDARGQIDRATLNALEIAWPLGPGWRTFASLAKHVAQA